MVDASMQHEELQELLISLTDGEIDGVRFDRLQSILSRDAEAQAYFRRYMRLCALLEFDRAESEGVRSIGQNDEGRMIPCVQEPDASFPSLSPLLSPHSPPFVGGPVFSYMVATVVLCAMLLSAWAYKITHLDGLVVDNKKPYVSPVERSEFVGRITGMSDCRWSDPAMRPYAGSYVSLGRMFELTSGLLEITYTSGAKVILEGPCSYTVDSDAGGYLRQGKLVARVEKNDELRMMNDESDGRNSNIHHSSFINHHLFSVRTPSAIVTDLGTEFGVVVDSSGNTRSYVFQGEIEIRPINADRSSGMILRQNESARIERSDSHAPRAIRDRDSESIWAEAFQRRIAKRVRISLFNTGINLQEREEDLHWQIVAVSNDSNFKPRQATVVECNREYWLYNQPWKSQWISIAGEWIRHPHGTYTFRTTFDLKGYDPKTVKLFVQFIADNHIRAIRLNGAEMPVPEHPAAYCYQSFVRFSIEKGFVQEINTLEFEVENGGAVKSGPENESEMGLRVELYGTAEKTK